MKEDFLGKTEEEFIQEINLGTIIIKVPYKTVKFTHGYNIYLKNNEGLNALILIGDASILEEIYRTYTLSKDAKSDVILTVYYEQVFGIIPSIYLVKFN